MSIQILGGLARGRSLSVPSGDLIRPTSVMLRRKIFDARQDLSGFNFYDLCAGSGAVGLEAWSRGASRVVLNEKNRKVQMSLEKNLALFSSHYQDEMNERPIQMKAQDCLSFLTHFRPLYEDMSDSEKESVILFFDPPYEDHKLYLNVLDQFKFESDQSWYKGELWLESDEQKGVKQKALSELKLPIVKNYVQGTSFVVIIKA